MKPCVQCRHCVVYEAHPQYSKCGHPDMLKPSSEEYLVTGVEDLEERMFQCTINRKYDCGAEGKYWEPIGGHVEPPSITCFISKKEPILKRVKFRWPWSKKDA